ncbi:MAG: Hsp33 family molecular chaperone HslO, partial [Staphylococcus sp.]|nr:Hsp33 family molecular chaperone HslO [Staphylococcus sp.]
EDFMLKAPIEEGKIKTKIIQYRSQISSVTDFIEKEIFKTLKAFEGMTWQEIDSASGGKKKGTNNHFIPFEDMIKEDHGAEAVCHFCGNKYHYSEGELQELLDTIKK